ncbi:hypothetical protein K432DRAFT_383548 [Lepidopterella palustris CBS 459.81]|uniref:Calcineurin-like phosphoesterase domain-containing protein n=1 Tax=Lepidopterella palustris CBS 459.81 TaxID=1314670 RepID=A0A8E2E869_9PEZI|nr:hypothetical protein K432DRAFT_383548 [Lepidopterella palustris CBS 459.81]
MRRISALLTFSRPTAPTFQILSDLHLEVDAQYASFDLPVCAPNLILAGDIGRLIDYTAYLGFLVRRTQLYERVFLVLGNHEFHGASFSAGIEAAQRLEREPALKGKLILLHQRRYDVPGSNVSVLGCTLWSRIPDEARDAVTARIKDFSKITRWSCDAHNGAHADDVSWLKSQVSANRKLAGQIHVGEPERQLLVVTHYAPNMRECSAPWQVGMPWSSAFATELLNGWDWSGVKLWVFGHTHYTTEFTKWGVRAVSNQRGYVGEGGGEAEIKGTEKKNVYNVRKVVRV